jgi:hypothetical protein
MKVKIRHNDDIEVEGFYIESNDTLYLIKEQADGIHIIECTDKVIFIQPQTANSLVLIDKNKLK